SSRRRHTRFSRDWSSDVCSSDLWPRGGVPTPDDAPATAWAEVEWGTWEVLAEPRDGRGAVWVVGLGPTVGYALEAAQGRPDVGVVDGRFVKPLDSRLLLELAAQARAIVTVEDHTVVGGLGSAVLEALADAGVTVPVVRLGVKDRVVPHGDPKAQHEELGYGPTAIAGTLDELGAAREGA